MNNNPALRCTLAALCAAVYAIVRILMWLALFYQFGWPVTIVCCIFLATAKGVVKELQKE